MKCPNCNSQIAENSKFCNNCGHEIDNEKQVEVIQTALQLENDSIQQATSPILIDTKAINEQDIRQMVVIENSSSQKRKHHCDKKILIQNLKSWVKNPISMVSIAISCILLITCIVLTVMHGGNDSLNSDHHVTSSNEAISPGENTLDLTFDTLTAIANLVGKKHNINYKKIEYANDHGFYSAGLYSTDEDVVRLDFSAKSPKSKAKYIGLTINYSELTDDNIEVFGDMFDYVLRFLDEKAYLDGPSKIWEELSKDCETNKESIGVGMGYYDTDKLSFSLCASDNKDIIISIYPK